jgi:undecaprenyl-diphosphatase
VNGFQAIVLGIVQGLTEFLPISSTAHLRIVPAFLGWDDPGAAFTAVVQLGTVAAILVYFSRDIVRIAWTWLSSFWRPELRGHLDTRMGWYIILGTIPIGIFGFAFKDHIESGARDLRLIAAALVALGLALLLADRKGRLSRPMERITFRDGAVIGAFQALALVPGVSRSGATITGGLMLGFTREAAARYSFLLSIPAVLVSGLFELKGATGGGGPGLVMTGLATIVAFVVGYASIAWLLRFLSKHSTAVFVVYRVALGCLVLALLAGGALTPR